MRGGFIIRRRGRLCAAGSSRAGAPRGCDARLRFAVVCKIFDIAAFASARLATFPSILLHTTGSSRHFVRIFPPQNEAEATRSRIYIKLFAHNLDFALAGRTSRCAGAPFTHKRGYGWREADAESGHIAALDVRTAGVGRGRPQCPQCPQCKILVDSRGANRQNTQRAMRLGT